MKKVLLFVLMIVGATFVHGQSEAQVERLQAQEMEKLTKRITYSNQNIAFTTNQKVKIERVLLDKAKEIVVLREQNVEKGDYVERYKKIEKKYEPKIERLLTTVQKIELKRNAKKQIKLSKH